MPPGFCSSRAYSAKTIAYADGARCVPSVKRGGDVTNSIVTTQRAAAAAAAAAFQPPNEQTLVHRARRRGL